MELDALNYDPEATQDDGSCVYPGPSFSGLVAEAVPGHGKAGSCTGVRHVRQPRGRVGGRPRDAEAPLFAMAATGFGQDSLGAFGFNEAPTLDSVRT